jgi:hypothetical protein
MSGKRAFLKLPHSVKNVQQNRRGNFWSSNKKNTSKERFCTFDSIKLRALEKYFEISVSALQVKDQADSAHSFWLSIEECLSKK